MSSGLGDRLIWGSSGRGAQGISVFRGQCISPCVKWLEGSCPQWGWVVMQLFSSVWSSFWSAKCFVHSPLMLSFGRNLVLISGPVWAFPFIFRQLALQGRVRASEFSHPTPEYFPCVSEVSIGHGEFLGPPGFWSANQSLSWDCSICPPYQVVLDSFDSVSAI